MLWLAYRGNDILGFYLILFACLYSSKTSAEKSKRNRFLLFYGEAEGNDIAL